MTAILVTGWRLGLGWLLGRHLLLLTTQERGGAMRRSIVPYRFYAGNLYVPAADAPWTADLDGVPRATAQAHPGPLGVRRRHPSPEEVAALGGPGWVVLEPTSEPVPLGVEPDLVWVWAVLGAAAVVAAAARRRRVTP